MKKIVVGICQEILVQKIKKASFTTLAFSALRLLLTQLQWMKGALGSLLCTETFTNNFLLLPYFGIRF